MIETGRLDKAGDLNILTNFSNSMTSELVTIYWFDTSNKIDTGWSLRLKRKNVANGDSGNNLMRIEVALS